MDCPYCHRRMALPPPSEAGKLFDCPHCRSRFRFTGVAAAPAPPIPVAPSPVTPSPPSGRVVQPTVPAFNPNARTLFRPVPAARPPRSQPPTTIVNVKPQKRRGMTVGDGVRLAFGWWLFGLLLPVFLVIGGLVLLAALIAFVH